MHAPEGKVTVQFERATSRKQFIEGIDTGGTHPPTHTDTHTSQPVPQEESFPGTEVPELTRSFCYNAQS